MIANLFNLIQIGEYTRCKQDNHKQRGIGLQWEILNV